MLQKLREKTTGWLAFVILGLLTVPFLFFGVENYFTQQVPTWVAKVGDKAYTAKLVNYHDGVDTAWLDEITGQASTANQ